MGLNLEIFNFILYFSFIIAEILTRYYPKELSIYTFDNGLNINKRKDNWE